VKNEDHPLSKARTFPWTTGKNLSEFESECRDWGFVYGLAYGMARGEDPYESTGSVSIRAMGAAIEAFKRWGGDDIFKADAFARDRAARPETAEVAA
jgi:hypothetical protein